MTTHSHKRTHPYHYQTVFHSVGTSLQICPSTKMPPNKHRLTVNTTKPRQYWNGFRNKNRTDIIYLASVTDVKDTWILLHIRMHNLTALNKNKTINSQSRVDCNVFIWPSLTEFIVQYLLFGFMFYCLHQRNCVILITYYIKLLLELGDLKKNLVTEWLWWPLLGGTEMRRWPQRFCKTEKKKQKTAQGSDLNQARHIN